jgi:hypothetical protein
VVERGVKGRVVEERVKKVWDRNAKGGGRERESGM